MVQKLSSGYFHKDSHFTDDAVEELETIEECMEKVERWNDDDQCQLCSEAMK